MSSTTSLRDVIYGLAIGDALGVPYEFKARGSFHATGMIGHGTHDQAAGTFSDDTSMALATCDSIRRCGRIDIDDMRKAFCDWMRSGKYAIDGRVFDIGLTVSSALQSGAGESSERSNGNGSLMRIAPLAYVDASDDEIRAASAITHAHPISTEGCVLFVNLIELLADGIDPKEAIGFLDFPSVYSRIDKIWELPAGDIMSSGYVVHTFEAAVWSLTTTGSYEECVLKAVNLGNDTDTVGAVAGALAGAHYGYDAIPRKWTKTLRGKDIIESCLF